MLFDETVKWKILTKFFEEPEKDCYVKELAKTLKISSGSASRICKQLEEEGIFQSEEKGNALFYSIKNREPAVRRLKSAWFLNKLMKFRDYWENEDTQSIVLYGSRASGDYISKSDVDILIISNADGKSIRSRFEKLRKALNVEVTLTIFPLSAWRNLSEKRDRFYTEVLANHILLFGSSVVIG